MNSVQEKMLLLSSEQAQLRERLNPKWRRALEVHRESLGIGVDTKGMGAMEIINRALKMQGYEPRKRKRRI